MAPETEILVHISAPSTASDEAKYRRQALGFLGFEAGRRHHVTAYRNQEDQGARKRRKLEITSELHKQDVNTKTTPASKQAETILRPVSAFQTPQQPIRQAGNINQSVTVNVGRTPLPETVTISIERTAAISEPSLSATVPDSVARFQSWTTPPSVVPDSQPSPLRARTSPSSTRSPPRARVDDPPVTSESSLNPIPTTRTTPTPSPHLPTLRSKASSSSSSSSTESAPPSTTPIHGNQGGEIESNPPPILLQAHKIPFCPSPSHIYPPQPATSLTPGPPQTYLTPSLLLLAHTLNLEQRFKPSKISRTIARGERGCWEIDIPASWLGEGDYLQKGEVEVDTKESGNRVGNRSRSEILQPANETEQEQEQEQDISIIIDTQPQQQQPPPPLSHRLWSFLNQFISEGRAGWGVWCCVEHHPQPQPLYPVSLTTATPPIPTTTTPSPTTIIKTTTTIKIFCFAELIPHIWLVLWLGSERRIKDVGVGARWVDGGGEGVVWMD
ncbi:hypothetical protein MMC09_002850 [Bachmanniomyces sp. S44760]|nr:hypothetical protein [Bachmanniomyces sp. S44760]